MQIAFSNINALCGRERYISGALACAPGHDPGTVLVVENETCVIWTKGACTPAISCILVYDIRTKRNFPTYRFKKR